MIKLENIQKRFDDGHEALKNVNLTCEEGEITVLIGPSGCGKTTTLKLMNRLVDHTNGSIYINKKEISEVSPVELRRGIGYVIQHVGLFPHMNISKNVAVVPNLLKWDKNKIDERVEELLNMVGLDPEIYRSRYPSELSGGQQQRIGVIRALAAEPPIILMDEPFRALDPISREQLQDELIDLQKNIQKTIVFVTHDMDEALKIADKIVLMKDGEVVQQGSPEEILRNPANEFVENFIGEKRLQRVQDIPNVEEIMNKKPVYISQQENMIKELEIMEKEKVDKLLVIDKNKYLKGYITIYDILNNYQDKEKLVKDAYLSFDNHINPKTKLSEAI